LSVYLTDFYLRIATYTVNEGVGHGTQRYVRQEHQAKQAEGRKYADGECMYLFVTPGGKYWRFDYRYLGKRKTLALGIYPDTTLAKARLKRASARVLLADGIDPSVEKRDEKQRRTEAAIQTFETVAHTWLIKTGAERAPTTQVKVTGWLKKDVFPCIGNMPIAIDQTARCVASRPAHGSPWFGGFSPSGQTNLRSGFSLRCCIWNY